jgi:hypothetical protein
LVGVAAGLIAVLVILYVGAERSLRGPVDDRRRPPGPEAPAEGARMKDVDRLDPGRSVARILDVVDAISAREQAVTVLVEGRDLLSSLSVPLGCESGEAAGPETFDLKIETAASRRLLLRAQFLDARLSGSEAQRAEAVWRDLRDLLRDIRERPSCVSREDLEELRRSIDRTQLMTRLGVVISGLDRPESGADGTPSGGADA